MKSPIASVLLEKNVLNNIEYYIAKGSEEIWFPESMLEKLRVSDPRIKTPIVEQTQALCSIPEYTGTAYLIPETENTRMRFARVGGNPEFKVHVCPKSGGHWVFNQKREKLEGIFPQPINIENDTQISTSDPIAIAPNPLDPKRFEDTRDVRERITNAFAEGFLGKGRVDRMTLLKIHVCLLILVPLFIIFVASKITAAYPSHLRHYSLVNERDLSSLSGITRTQHLRQPLPRYWKTSFPLSWPTVTIL